MHALNYLISLEIRKLIFYLVFYTFYPVIEAIFLPKWIYLNIASDKQRHDGDTLNADISPPRGNPFYYLSSCRSNFDYKANIIHIIATFEDIILNTQGNF